MNPESPESRNAEETILYWEAQLEQDGRRISIEGQNELRQLLQEEMTEEMRSRLIHLLNPRRARIVRLSSRAFSEEYCVTASDNYGKAVGDWDTMAYFDAVHGYYVSVQIRPLPPRRLDSPQ